MPVRNTKQRALILAIMRENHTHPTADEVYELAREQDAHISRGTVYRNLNALAEAGELRRLSMPGGPDHYDSRFANHYHFLCRECRKTVDVAFAYQDGLNAPLPDLPGFKVEWHQLLFGGLCPDCAARRG